jgi:hypothetical protein
MSNFLFEINHFTGKTDLNLVRVTEILSELGLVRSKLQAKDLKKLH